jgi:toxin-antitoxin system PIN domain toxin
MILCDVNVLVYAHRQDSASHVEYMKWLEDVVNGDGAFAASHIVLSGFLRIVTNPRIFKAPTPIKTALRFTQDMLERVNCVIVAPGPRHWEIFTSLCTMHDLKGNLIPDAYLAALAIESGCTWATTDGDYARFPSLSRIHPLRENA